MKKQIKKTKELRKQQTKAEYKLWQMLRNRDVLGLKFRRQHPVKSFIVDFCCLSHQLIIELDGESHNNAFQQEYDFKRTRIIEKLGYTVLKFENKMVFNKPEFIISEINKHIENPLTPTLSPRRGSLKVLSTKTLTLKQQEILKGFELTHYNAIEIEKLEFSVPTVLKNVLITSQNTAKILIKNKLKVAFIFCVGNKTAALLKGNGYQVKHVAKNALALGKHLVENYKQEEFVFFCGNKRREELPSMLLQNNIKFKEQIVYNTHLVSRKFQKQFDAVLFFSPSGVESYVSNNDLEDSVAFCIGETTAKTVKKYTDSIIVANETTVESVLEIVNQIIS